MAKKPEDALRVVVDEFADREILAFLWHDGEIWRVRSSATEEPERKGAFRHVSYFVRGAPYPDRNDCSVVEFRWLLERRGYDDVGWSIEAQSPGFRPRSFAEIAEPLRERPCPPNR